MNLRLPLCLTAFALSAGMAHAASVMPVFTDQGVATTGQETHLFRADLTGLGLSKIAQVTINDSNSGVGGSPGAYSGFDLDAIFLDVDGDAATTGDQVYASSFTFSAGTLRPGGLASNTAGALNGSASDTMVDEAFATLNAIDALFFSTGSISLGDGGSLGALFAPDVMIGASLYLFVGEVAGNGESINGLIEISDTPPAVPLPASALLLGTALAGGAAVGRRRRKTQSS